MTAERRPRISSARSRAERALEHLAGVLDAALGDVVRGAARVSIDLLDDGLGGARRRRRRSFAISSVSSSISSSREVLEDLGGALLGPSATSRTAAFRRPLAVAAACGAARRIGGSSVRSVC